MKKFLCKVRREMDSNASYPLTTIVADLLWMHDQCSTRKLVDGAKWSSELLFNLDPDGVCTTTVVGPSDASLVSSQSPRMRFVATLMDNQEYARAAKLTENCTDSVATFLHYYALFLAGEKCRLDSISDVTDKRAKFDNKNIGNVHKSLEEKYNDDQLDSFLTYLYGVILCTRRLSDEARQVLVRSITMAPAFWPAWAELTKLIDNKTQLQSLQLPDHWLLPLFTSECHMRLQMDCEARDGYTRLVNGVFAKSSYVRAQLAVALHQAHDFDGALSQFESCHNDDPYRLEHMDLYSNTLFGKRLRVELSVLAHHCFELNKYSPETCIVTGNYYSLRGDHELAVSYFQRALKLDPSNVGAWTLMGHEFMELKNTAAACLAYHNALENDKNDYRAWYGLGQMYDILKMPSHAVYYYNKAHKCRPTDSRMIIGLGDMYLKNNKNDRALKCYWKAHSVGDIEGLALWKLAKLFEKEGDSNQAASCYMKYLDQLEQQEVADAEHQPPCFRFLANYFMSKGKLDEAHTYAQLCLEYDATKEDGKCLLKQISQSRTDGSGGDQSSAPDSNMPGADDSSMMIVE